LNESTRSLKLRTKRPWRSLSKWSCSHLRSPNVDAQRREVGKLKYRIQVLAGKGYLARLGKQQDIDAALLDIEREFEDLRDLLVVSVCTQHYII
jgi:hypothetical protein